MTPDPPLEPLGDDEPDRLTRRRFVASGVVLGAAVVWTSPFPFADEAIGATIHSNVDGPTGPTGPTGPAETGSTGTTAPTGTTGPAGTGTTGPTGQNPPELPDDATVRRGLNNITELKVGAQRVRFKQHYIQPGFVAWNLYLMPAGAKATYALRPTRIGKKAARKKVARAGRPLNTVDITKRGRTLLKEHPSAQLVLYTTFTDPRGHRIHAVKRLRRH
jgi:hypothetical protein